MALFDTHARRVAAAVALVRGFAPAFRLQAKSRSALHRALGWLLGRVGGAAYMTRYWSTVGYAAAWPTRFDQAWDGLAWVDVLHEGAHALQARRRGRLLHTALYLCPQLGACGALLVLALCGASWWALLPLLLLAPLPAPYRAWCELDAYEAQYAAAAWGLGVALDTAALTAMVTGPAYWWMWPFRARVQARLDAFAAVVASGAVPADPYLAAVQALALRVRGGAV